MEDWRIKLSVLWLFAITTGLLTIIISFLEPGVIQGIIAGQLEGQTIGPQTLLLSAALLLVPPAMAFLSLVLPASANRWTNIALGIIFFITGLTDLPGNLADQSAHGLLLNFSILVDTALIFLYAWRAKPKP